MKVVLEMVGAARVGGKNAGLNQSRMRMGLVVSTPQK